MSFWKCKNRSLSLHHAHVMGILNVTPDSFSDGGKFYAQNSALERARKMIAEGAAIIDVGGESTRPGAPAVTPEEEMERVLPVIESLVREWDGLISIDTSKHEVAKAALNVGAHIVNDVCGLRDERMVAVCAESGCGVVVMHMLGTPDTMQIAPHYENVVSEVRAFFLQKMHTLTNAGILLESLCFDPGIGFGKTVAHNVELLRNLHKLHVHNVPLLLGVSKKSFIGKLLGEEEMDKRGEPTVAITAMAREAGVMLHRVHDVLPNVHALKMIEAVITPRC